MINSFSNINLIEIALISTTTILTLVAINYIRSTKYKLFTWGFTFIAIWNVIAILAEFFVKNSIREVTFNTVGYFILLVGLVLIIAELKWFSKQKVKKPIRGSLWRE